MTETTTVTAPVAEKKASSGKPSNGAAKATKKGAKKVAKKSAKKAATKKAPVAKDGLKLGKPFLLVLKALSKAGKPLTRTQIGEKTGINSGFTSILGHLDKTKAEPQSLVARGFIKAEQFEDSTSVVYSITAAGRAAFEKSEK